MHIQILFTIKITPCMVLFCMVPTGHLSFYHKKGYTLSLKVTDLVARSVKRTMNCL